ncbi:hypothetical protein [Streptomyces sp. JNUCC 63]
MQLRLGADVVWDEQLKAVGTQEMCAIGDVARWHNPRYGERIRVEHWTSTADRAVAVTRTLTGVPTACDALPQVRPDQFDRRLQAVIGRGVVRPLLPSGRRHRRAPHGARLWHWPR